MYLGRCSSPEGLKSQSCHSDVTLLVYVPARPRGRRRSVAGSGRGVAAGVVDRGDRQRGLGGCALCVDG
jgi:hypothetical protein